MNTMTGTTTSATAIPIPGTPAYWVAQREAVALLKAYNFGHPDLFAELGALRQIAAHGFAASMMAAQGHCLADLINGLERMAEALEAEDEEEDPDAPPHGQDWCPRGCQPMHGMECGMCGHDGPGVWADAVSTVADYCCHCRARTYQSPDGICELCGKDAEDADDTPAAAGPAACVRPGHPPQPRTAEAQDTRRGPRAAAPACSTLDRGR